VVWKKGNNIHCVNIFSHLFDKIDNFTFIVLTIIAPVFDLGMSFGKI